VTLPRAGQPGHGRTTSLRRQMVWMADDRKARCTGAYEVICRDCGDHPYLGYSEISPRLQRIRGPYTLAAGVAAYAKHLGLATSPAAGRGRCAATPPVQDEAPAAAAAPAEDPYGDLMKLKGTP
jgi:hypothetical protein